MYEILFAPKISSNEAPSMSSLKTFRRVFCILLPMCSFALLLFFSYWFRRSDSSSTLPSVEIEFLNQVHVDDVDRIAVLTNRYRAFSLLDAGTFLHSVRAFGDLKANEVRRSSALDSISRFYRIYERHDGPAVLDASASPLGTSHRHQLLSVLGEQGVAPETTIEFQGGRCTVQLLLDQSLSGYTHSGEIEWSIVAFASYLPPTNSWVNRFGHTFSFDDAARLLIARPFEASSCAGTHALFALAYLDQANGRCSGKLLSFDTAKLVADYLKNISQALELLQDDDGSIPHDWYRLVAKSDWYLKTIAMAGASTSIDEETSFSRWVSERKGESVRNSDRIGRILATGHHLEWLIVADQYIPSLSFYERALRYCEREVNTESKEWQSMGPPILASEISCPIHHMVRVLRIAYGLEHGN